MKNWYALYTKPNKEGHVESVLNSRGIETYLPTIEVYVRKRDARVSRPFFPCYLFARIDFTTVSRSSISWTPGLRRIVSFGGQPTAVSEEIVSLIRERLTQVKEAGGLSKVIFKKGDVVRIKEGPLRDLDAIFEQHLSAAERVKILVNILGRLTPVEVEVDWLEKLH